ncbi:YrhK family protein [Chachezhania antarctica]|uniref:YrhK family protein n=1 Tax=Chachezhania antarctica TaxID=2340860 RepID=UPI000EAD20B7|nr:YrhK family protein [Chachezhania antarctica]|tara:strand:+ start:6565 stop:6858 length:294 start_codon:yes stop_codon:yes gene_type:complete
MFNPDLQHASATHSRVTTRYKIAYTAIDFMAAIFFIIGSILFFYDDTVLLGTWSFLIGSILFAARPTVTLAREIHLSRLPIPNVPDPGDLPPVFSRS